MIRMRVRIDHASSVPPYEQLRLQLAGQINDGTLAVGSKLPTVRALAIDLGIAANTVARAYRELEQAGLVETRGRAGTLVTARAAATPAAAQRAAQRYAEQAGALGLTPQAALELVRAALKLPG